MHELKDIPNICPLFAGINENYITSILASTGYSISYFHKNQIIALEGEAINGIGIILEGTVEIQKNYPTGRNVVIRHMHKGDVFGEVIVFSEIKEYPSTIFSASPSKILFISKHCIIKLCSTSEIFLNNFMELLSNRILLLSQKLKNLSYQTIREKLASYLIEEYSKQKSRSINLPFSRKEMADQLGITRPSLSRELINMKKDGLIDLDNRTIVIKDLDALENTLF